MNLRAERTVTTMAEWYEKEGKDSDVVLSTKVCIVRNVKGYNFMPRLSDAEFRSLYELVDSVVDKNKFDGGAATSMDKETVMRLIKLQLLGREGSELASPNRKAVYFNEDGSCSLTVGSGEHLTVRVMTQGHDISIYKEAEKEAMNLESKLDIAYSENYGFLTSNVRLAGTGLKILYTVALPAIAKTEGGIAALRQRVGQYEWNIYPFSERGELADSCIYIIASVNTLGVTEEDVIKRGEMLISDIIKAERACRDEIAENQKAPTEDIYGRSYGILRYCGQISRTEALDALGWLRLYRDHDDMGEIKISWESINKLTMGILWEPGASAKKNQNSVAILKNRAKEIRAVLKGDD